MNIIIVHTNERSLGRSIEIASRQGDVTLVSERPFSQSLRKSFLIGSKWDWFTLIGGDQYLYPNAIKRIEKIIPELDDNIFRISFRGWDHLFQRHRLMAPCVYRGSMLSEALKIDSSHVIRPELFIAGEMMVRGYSNKVFPDILAIHDKDQYYRDIYRKGVFSAEKSLAYINNLGLCNSLSFSNDPDHAVFMRGIKDYIDGAVSDDILKELNIKEKAEL